MTHAQIVAAILSLLPGAQFALSGTDLDGMQWIDTRAKPDAAAIEAEVARLAALPPPPPQQISDRQFFQQLAIQGVITEDEALAAVQTGAIPASMMPAISALATDEQFAAKMAVSGDTVFVRGDPMTEAIRVLMGWTPAQTDALWVAAAAL